MSLFSRFFGRRKLGDAEAFGLTAATDKVHSISLQVLFEQSALPDASAIEKALRSYHASAAKARCELSSDLQANGTVFGMAGFGPHVVRLVGFGLPFPADAVEACVAPSHYGQDIKARVRAHQSHIILYYAGQEKLAVEQYVVLAMVAGAMSALGGIAVLNESARTSLPCAFLSPESYDEDIVEVLRTLPLPFLYCGFVKYNVEGVAGVWMRTYGADLLGLPDFAALAGSHAEGQKYFDAFSNVYSYLLKTGAKMVAGNTMQLGAESYFRLRAPDPGEYYLTSKGTMLVAEIIGAEQINR